MLDSGTKIQKVSLRDFFYEEGVMREIGKYIAGLTNEERDRIISGIGWCRAFEDEHGDRCMVSHARGWRLGRTLALDVEQDRYAAKHREAWRAFDMAAQKYGIHRVVRAVKARAARLNGSSPEAITALLAQSETVQA